MPPHTGPQNENSKWVDMTIGSLNITSINSAITSGVINSSLAHTMFLQETSVAPNKFADAISQIRIVGFKIIMSGTDPEFTYSTRGLATLAPKKMVMQRLTPAADEYKQVVKSGRLDITALPLPSGALLTVANIYGWTNARNNTEAADRMNNLIDVAFKELSQAPQGPKLLVGDLNGDTRHFEVLQAALDNDEYIDIGNSPLYNDQVGQPTCFTSGGHPTRRDYVIGNRFFQQMLTTFEVIHIPEVPTHRLLRVHFRCLVKQEYVTRSIKSPSVTSFLCDALKQKLQLKSEQQLARKAYNSTIATLRVCIERHLHTHDKVLQQSNRDTSNT